MPNVLRTWWDQASPEQKKVLAELSGSSVNSLHQMAKGYRTKGQLRVRADTAIRLEQASRQIEGLPVLNREDLSPVCAGCDYLKRCKDENL